MDSLDTHSFKGEQLDHDQQFINQVSVPTNSGTSEHDSRQNQNTIETDRREARSEVSIRSSFDSVHSSAVAQEESCKQKPLPRRSIFTPASNRLKSLESVSTAVAENGSLANSEVEPDPSFIFSSSAHKPSLSVEGLDVSAEEISRTALITSTAGLRLRPTSPVLAVYLSLVPGRVPGDPAIVYLQPTVSSRPIACLKVFFCLLEHESLCSDSDPHKNQELESEWPTEYLHRIKLSAAEFFQIIYFEQKQTMLEWVEVMRPFTILREGDFLSRYKIIAEVAQGSFAHVLEATDISTNQSCAIKSYSLELMRKDPAETACILREISILSGISHPNCLKLLGVYLTATKLLLVSDYFDGGDLLVKIVRREQIPPNIAIRHLWELLNAMAYLESVGVVHRDIKPQNIILRNSQEDSDICLVDFGFAAQVRPGVSPSDHCGTKSFAAPEILAGDYHDTRADVFSAGVVLHLMLFGSLPPKDSTVSKNLDSNTGPVEALEDVNSHDIFTEAKPDEEEIRTRVRSFTLRDCPLNLGLHNQGEAKDAGENMVVPGKITREDCELMQSAINLARLMLAQDYRQRPLASALLKHEIFDILQSASMTTPSKRPNNPNQAVHNSGATDEKAEQLFGSSDRQSPLKYSTPSRAESPVRGEGSPNSPHQRTVAKGYNPKMLEYLVSYAETQTRADPGSPSLTHSPTFVKTMEKVSRYQKAKQTPPNNHEFKQVKLFGTADSEERRVTF